MKITPLDIRHKEFSRSMRGYKDLEVDEFLDEIVEEFERLFNENIDYKERLETLEEKVSQYRNIEETLQKTLISAQEQAEDLKVNATKEAELILRDAELKARTVINDSYAERQKIQRSVQALKQKHDELRYQLKSLLDSYLKTLDQDEYESREEDYTGDTGYQETDIRKEISPDESAGDSYMSIDDAVREELEATGGGADAKFGEEAFDNTAGGAESYGSATMDDSGEAEDIQEPVSFPALHPDGETDEGNPFADVEVDTDEKKFDW